MILDLSQMPLLFGDDFQAFQVLVANQVGEHETKRHITELAVRKVHFEDHALGKSFERVDHSQAVHLGGSRPGERAYKEKSRRSFFTLNSVETASPIRLKQSAGSEFVNSSLSEERLEMLDRLRQIIAILEALVAVLREMYLQNKDDFCVLRRQH